MDQRTREACNRYEEKLLEAAEYSGNREPNKKIFSASSLSSTLLQKYLKFKHGTSKQKKFESNTLGSIYQLGVDKAFEGDDNYQNAYRIKHEISNGWIISGEMDQVDNEYKIIFDNKVTTPTAIGKVFSEKEKNGYALQLSVYRWLMYKEHGELYSAILPMVDKNSSYFKDNKYDQLTFAEPVLTSLEEIEDKLLEATNELDHYIDLDIEPEKCDKKDLWLFKPRGSAKAKPMRCIYYCDVSKHCKHYNSDYHESNKLMDL